MRRAAATAAWPSASPPSLAGTSACVSTVKPRAAQARVHVRSNSMRVLEAAAGKRDGVEARARHRGAQALRHGATAPRQARWKRAAIVPAGYAVREIGAAARARAARGSRSEQAVSSGCHGEGIGALVLATAVRSASASSRIAASPS